MTLSACVYVLDYACVFISLRKNQLIKRIGYLEMVYTMIYAWKEIKGDSS